MIWCVPSQDRKSHFERIKADGESFKQQVKMQTLEEKAVPRGGNPKGTCSRCVLFNCERLS